MGKSVKNAALLHYTEEELLQEWKLRKGLVNGRRDCETERDDGIDTGALLQREIAEWYAALLDTAPAAWLPVEDIAGECTAKTLPGGSALVAVPARCARILEVKMGGWKRSCCLIEKPGSRLARRQANEWLKGGAENPVCVETPSGLAAYSVEGTASVELLMAVCRPPEKEYVFSERAWATVPSVWKED